MRLWSGLVLLAAACSPAGEAPCPRGAERVTPSVPDGSSQREVACETPDGTRLGPMELRFDGRVLVQGSYEDGARHGDWRFYSTEGHLLQKVSYREGKVHALELSMPPCPEGARLHGQRPPDGDAVWCQVPGADGAWVNQGPFASWYANGQLLAVGDYRGGVQEGPFSMWYPNGQLKGRGAMKAGLAEGAWTSWHDNGVKHIVATFARGEEEGAWVSYWEEGGKSADGQFLHGWESGTWTFWHPSGRLAQQGAYHDGKRVGWWRRWDAEGKELGMIEYQEGVEVSSAASPVGP